MIAQQRHEEERVIAQCRLRCGDALAVAVVGALEIAEPLADLRSHSSLPDLQRPHRHRIRLESLRSSSSAAASSSRP